MASRRKAHGEEHENAERWLLTYADMITLLMAFFIMLYAMSQLDIRKFDAMTGSVQAQLGGTGVLKGAMNAVQGPESSSGHPGIGTLPSGGSKGSLQQQAVQELRPLVTAMGGSVKVTEEGAEVSLPASTLYFAPGSAEPTRPMLAALQRLAGVLKRGEYSVAVVGHTCDLPVRNEQFTSNWELSSERARNVAFRLIRYGGVSAGHCTYVGRADTEPVAPNDTAAHRARNRRVELKIRPLDGGSRAVTVPAAETASKSAPRAGTQPVRSPAKPIDIRPHLGGMPAPRKEVP
jgi:chemotaxis protein MotB